MSKFDLGDYVDVEARLRWFFDHFPEGSLGSKVLVGPEAGKDFVVVQASAYRDRYDPQPGQGLAYEVFPGTTPYTKGSELMNAETSAWGRALAAIGAPTKGHVASADEVSGAIARRGQAVPSDSEPVEQQPEPQAEQTSEGGDAVATSEGPDGAGTVASGGDPASGQSLPSDHEHEWMQSPTLKSFVVCKDPACRKVVKKSEAGVDA